MHRVLDGLFNDTPNGTPVKDCGSRHAVDRMLKDADIAQSQGYEVPPIPSTNPNVELVTPEVAAELLREDKKMPNRRISDKHVDTIADDIEGGRFYTTNQGIGIDDNGSLIDGQHRLSAIIKTGKPQWLVVVRGLDPAAMLAVDRNRRRTLANHYQILEKGHATILASSALLVARAKLAWFKGWRISSARGAVFSDYRKMEVADRIASEIDLDKASSVARKLNDKKAGGPGFPPSVGAAFYYLTTTGYGHEEHIEEFVEQLRGINSGPGRAAFVLRNKVPDIKKSTKSDQLMLLAFLITAFNKFTEAKQGGYQEDVTYLRLPKDGQLPQLNTYTKAVS